MKTNKIGIEKSKDVKINNALSLKFRRYIERIKEDNGYVIDRTLNCVIKIIGIVICKDENIYPILKDEKISFNELSRRNGVMHIMDIYNKPSEILATYKL